MDDLNLLIGLGVGTVLVVGSLVGIIAGIRRMQGKRSRSDRFFELIARAQGASVYPPSLRGNPDPQVQEDVEVTRGDRAVRETPGEDVHTNRTPDPGSG
jgi:hypothetical protein